MLKEKLMSKETSYPGRQDFIYLRQRVGGRKKNFLIEKSKGLQVKFLENTASYFKLVKDCHMARGLGLIPYGFGRERYYCWLAVTWRRIEMTGEYRSNS